LPHPNTMKTAIAHHLNRLVRQYGSWNRVARALGLDPRNLRRNRNKDAMNPPTKRVLVLAGKLLALRQLLRHLRKSGAITPAQIKEAWGKQPLAKDPTS